MACTSLLFRETLAQLTLRIMKTKIFMRYKISIFSMAHKNLSSETGNYINTPRGEVLLRRRNMI